ncbi:AAA family ATPase [Celerinatantimonas sp. YJH-8]|uniref:AAA family ATPase n=1 Tax=Celerinatantimonas sp. YJH-8 TaxID=3228714 RepID=UPI0038C64036
MRGVPGSGKSSLARRLCDQGLNGRGSRQRYLGICSADQYFYDQNGTYHFEASRLVENHARNLWRFRRLVHYRWPLVICDNTNMYSWMLDGYLQALSETDYQIDIYELAGDASIRQLQQFAARNQHQVSLSVIQNMLTHLEPVQPDQKRMIDHYYRISAENCVNGIVVCEYSHTTYFKY